jgi:hypothetical protein
LVGPRSLKHARTHPTEPNPPARAPTPSPLEHTRPPSPQKDTPKPPRKTPNPSFENGTGGRGHRARRRLVPHHHPLLRARGVCDTQRGVFEEHAAQRDAQGARVAVPRAPVRARAGRAPRQRHRAGARGRGRFDGPPCAAPWRVGGGWGLQGGGPRGGWGGRGAGGQAPPSRPSPLAPGRARACAHARVPPSASPPPPHPPRSHGIITPHNNTQSPRQDIRRIVKNDASTPAITPRPPPKHPLPNPRTSAASSRTTRAS